MNQVWTVQPRVVWQKLQEQKVLFVDESIPSSHPDWQDSYDWMREQMWKRVPGYRGHYPWWGWLASGREYVESDQVDAEGRSLFVRIDLSLPDDRILVSHRDGWSYVINRWYVPYTEKEAREWYKKRESYGDDALPESDQALSDATWERIFDLDLPARGMEEREGLEHGLWVEDFWQVCFEELRLEDVVSVEGFTPT